MPDAHVGYGLPIGGVLATHEAVIPYAVGVDIACRMRLSHAPVALPGLAVSAGAAAQRLSALADGAHALRSARDMGAPRPARSSGTRRTGLAGDAAAEVAPDQR